MISKRKMPDKRKNARVWSKAEYFAHKKNIVEQSILEKRTQSIQHKSKLLQQKSELEIHKLRRWLKPLNETTGYNLGERPMSSPGHLLNQNANKKVDIKIRSKSAFPKISSCTRALKSIKTVPDTARTPARKDEVNNKLAESTCSAKGEAANSLNDTKSNQENPQNIISQDKTLPSREQGYVDNEVCSSDKNTKNEKNIGLNNTINDVGSKENDVKEDNSVFKNPDEDNNSISEKAEHVADSLELHEEPGQTDGENGLGFMYKYALPAQLLSVYETQELKNQRDNIKRNKVSSDQLSDIRTETFLKSKECDLNDVENYIGEDNVEIRSNHGSEYDRDTESLLGTSTATSSFMQSRHEGALDLNDRITNQPILPTTFFQFQEVEETRLEDDERPNSPFGNFTQENINRQVYEGYSLYSLNINKYYTANNKFGSGQIIGRGPVEKPRAVVEKELAAGLSPLTSLRNTATAAVANEKFKKMTKTSKPSVKVEVKTTELKKKPKKNSLLYRFARTIEAELPVDHLVKAVKDLHVPLSAGRIRRERQNMTKRKVPVVKNLETERMEDIQERIKEFLAKIEKEI